MRDLEELFRELGESAFRSRFRLKGKELTYLRAKGLPVVLEHAADFVEKRLAPAEPANDGRQTPMGHHPAFVAQHATATCCRGCLSKWHRIPKGRPLSDPEKRYVLCVIERWLEGQVMNDE
ncbi:MAG: hypothetical protein QOE46_1496 [Acidobacteriota bacterium]|jgi:hypothetical protein|nr:hypothetical protein [Acidobacteriota bacterium]